MAEVIIELNLNRRSGVLAAAIAALRDLPLSFTSQQLVDQDSAPRLILTTEGQVGSLAEVVEAYAGTRGVSAVASVRVDGIPLASRPMDSGDDPGANQSVDAGSGGESPEKSTRASALDPEPPSAAGKDQVEPQRGIADPNASPALTDEFNDEAFARLVLVDPTAGDRRKEAVSAGGPQANGDAPERGDKSTRGGLKAALLRRRRRIL